MRRHPIFFCSLILLILIGNRWLPADEGRLSKQLEQTNSSIIDPRPILTQWSVASRFLSPVTPSPKVEEFKKENQAYFSGHELTLISDFQQPVTTHKLLSDYDWRVVKQTKTNIILRGQPRDVLTRHLCRPFELQISTRSMMPESLTFLSDPAKQKQGFASIELTAYKVAQTKALVETDSPTQSVLRTVAKAVFLPDGKQHSLISAMRPIKHISFSRSSSENKNMSELREIEKLVSRWIKESRQIDSIKLGNGATIFKHGDNRHAEVPAMLNTKADGTRVSGWPAFLQVLPPWLFDVDQQTFIIESFTIELSSDDKGPSAPRFITLKIKPNPASPPKYYPGAKWDTAEIVFNSEQPLPIKISETTNNRVVQFLLSGMKVQYEE